MLPTGRRSNGKAPAVEPRRNRKRKERKIILWLLSCWNVITEGAGRIWWGDTGEEEDKKSEGLEARSATKTVGSEVLVGANFVTT